MDPTDNLPPGNLPEDVRSPLGELIVQNGRQNCGRWVLSSSLTLVGSAYDCDVRLGVEGVHPYHCALCHTPAGLLFRHFQTDLGTQVNGQSVSTVILREGDILTVGPFRFRVLLPTTATASAELQALEQEKEALRIQAAAVAAQQAALSEEEIRLQQRRTASEQQERQLASLLEEKRLRLVTLRDEARQAHTALQKERADYEQRVAEVMQGLASARREVADNNRQNQTERQRLFALRWRLKRRWHKHWSLERAAMCRKETQLCEQLRALEQERARLEKEKHALAHARLRFNGEVELTRRQLQANQQQLKQARAEHSKLVHRLNQREFVLLSEARRCDQERRRQQAVRSQLHKEAEGLESRIRNYRLTIREQEQRLAGLQEGLRPLQEGANASPLNGGLGEAPPRTTDAPLSAKPALVQQCELALSQAEADLPSHLALLENAAEELADQRLALAEQCERLARAQQHWDADRQAALVELEAAGHHLREHQDALRVREQALESNEQSIMQQADEVGHMRRSLEAQKARLEASAAAWEGERGRLLQCLEVRTEEVEQRLEALQALRQRWDQRRRRQVVWLWNQGVACVRLRREYAVQRDEWSRRNTLLIQEQNTLAGRALALEQYRQECLGRAADPKAAEKRMERLRRRVAVASIASQRLLAQERRYFEAEAARIDGRSRQLQEYALELATQQADLTSRQAVWEQERFVEMGERQKLQQELEMLVRQRNHYEQQVATLQDEIEHLATLLLDEADPPPMIKAA